MRIAVTGGSGRAGRYVVLELLQHGHDVTNVDVSPCDDSRARFLRADVCDFGQVLPALRDVEAVVHLAGIPGPLNNPPDVVFSTNVLSLWNVLQAAEVLGIPRIVFSSSINAIGASFSRTLRPPLFFPIDEAQPTRAEDPYALSKWVGEQIADGFARRRMVQIASLRLHGLWDDARYRDLREHPISDPQVRAKNFWGYVHLDDCASACRLALEKEWQGHEVMFINASDTVLSIPTAEALAQVYPGVPLKKEFRGFEATISIEKAKRLLGWEPLRSWRNA
jgi:nucleoside-diphosphate-sugar epimerase